MRGIKMRYTIKSCPWVSKYYGPEDDAGGAGGGAGGDSGGAGGGDAGGKPPEKTFRQADVDRIVKDRLKNERIEKEKLISDLTKLRDQASLTTQDRDELSQRIESMEASLRTKEENFEIEKKRAAEKYTRDLDKASQEAKGWQERFTKSTIRRSLTDAAVATNAEDTDQIVMMFSGNTRLEEERDSAGKLTGDFIAMMKVQGIDVETKKPTMLDLPVREAMQHLRDNGLHKNLFKHGAVAGTGQEGGGNSGKGTGDPSKMPLPGDYQTTEAFRDAYDKWRNKKDK
jgi:hypothetical protein